MDTKHYISLEVKKGEHTFSFNLPHGATWGNALDAAFDFIEGINQLSRQSVNQLRPAESEGDV